MGKKKSDMSSPAKAAKTPNTREIIPVANRNIIMPLDFMPWIALVLLSIAA